MIALLLALQMAVPLPIMVDCMPGPWIVFFNRDDTVLDAEDRSILESALATRRGICGGDGRWRFVVAGFSDRSENGGVDRRRARVVGNYLRRSDVMPRPRVRWYGTRPPRVARVDGSAEPQNSRVEIIVSPSE